MNTTATRSFTCASDQAIAELVERFLERIQAGETVDPEAFAAGHREHADALREVLPAVAAMAQLRAAVTEGGVSPVHDELSQGSILGDYRILREVGRGGMGIVYEAEQLSLGRRVAVKTLQQSAARDPRQLARFHVEVHAVAALNHPHIVPIFSVGIDRGVHYFAMQYIEGRSFAQMMRQPLRDRDAASRDVQIGMGWNLLACLGLQAAEAIEHAHAMGILHRDIKPANIILDERAHLWLVDFGLARFQSGGDHTLSGDVLGTLRYMSPEQAFARGVIDGRSDIYSLGVTLYELLAGQPAVGGRDRQQVMHQIASDEPVRLRKLDRRIPADLETIIHKAAAKEPSDRYLSAGELAADLRRFLGRQPILARRPGPMQHAARWVQRHKAGMATAVGVLLIALFGLAYGLVTLSKEQRRTKENLDLALRALDRSLDLGEEGVQKSPSSPDVQESLGDALRLYRRLAVQNPRDRHAVLAGAKAYRRVGDIRASLGQLDLAEDAYREADHMLERLIALDRLSAVYRDERAELLSHWGKTVDREGPTRRFQGSLDALGPLRMALKIDHALLAEFPGTTRYQHRFVQDALSLSGILFIPRWLPQRKQSLPRRLPEMEQVLSQARDVLNDLVLSSNADRFAMIVDYKHLGDMLHATGRSEAGALAYDRSLALLGVVTQESLADPSCYHRFIGLLEHMRQQSFCLTNQPEKQEGFYSRALPAWDQVVTRLDLTPFDQTRCAQAYFSVGTLFDHNGHNQEAVVPLSKAVQLGEDLVRKYPLVPEYRRQSSEYHQRLGHSLLAAGRGGLALPHLQRAIELMPDSRALKETIAWDLVFYPNPAPEKAVELAGVLVKEKPDSVSYWSRLGQAQVRTGDWARGQKSLEKVIGMSNGGDPDDWLFLSMALSQLGDRDSARHWYEQARVKLDQTPDHHDPALESLLAEAAGLMRPATPERTTK